MFKQFLANVWNDIKGAFTAGEQAVLTFFQSAIHSVAQNGGQVLIDTAIAAVAAAEKAGGTAQAKFAAAQAQVIQILQQEGVPVVLNAVNAAIEAAVAALPSSVGRAAIAAATMPAKATTTEPAPVVAPSPAEVAAAFAAADAQKAAEAGQTAVMIKAAGDPLPE